MDNELKVARVITVFHSFAEADQADREYWWSRTPLELWQYMELLRQLNYGYDPATTRMQRVLEIVERPRKKEGDSTDGQTQ